MTSCRAFALAEELKPLSLPAEIDGAETDIISQENKCIDRLGFVKTRKSVTVQTNDVIT